MKKTNISALLLAALLLIQLLCAPVSAVTAEPAADAQADAQTASDNSAGDAAAEADSVPEDQLLSSREQFSVAAKAALLIDLNTNRVVYEQDADERVYPASLTKIMTCLIALENGNLSDVVTVSESALAAGESAVLHDGRLGQRRMQRHCGARCGFGDGFCTHDEPAGL